MVLVHGRAVLQGGMTSFGYFDEDTSKQLAFMRAPHSLSLTTNTV